MHFSHHRQLLATSAKRSALRQSSNQPLSWYYQVICLRVLSTARVLTSRKEIFTVDKFVIMMTQLSSPSLPILIFTLRREDILLTYTHYTLYTFADYCRRRRCCCCCCCYRQWVASARALFRATPRSLQLGNASRCRHVSAGTCNGNVSII